MIYTIPTKRGLGVEIWGTYDDLKIFHEFIGKFWNNDDFKDKEDYVNRDLLISAFSYDIRKAFQGSRLTSNNSHFSLEPIKYFGVEISWVHFLFSLAALRHNSKNIVADKFDLSLFLQLEYWLEKSMHQFDAIGAKKLIPFITEGIYSGNPYLYQFMRNINANYFRLGGEIAAFRKLPDLMNCAKLNHKDYLDYVAFLNIEATRLNCAIYDLEIDDNDIEYDRIQW